MRLTRALARRTPAQRRLLVRAAANLSLAAVLIRLAPFPRTVGFGAVKLGRRVSDDVGDILWAVAAAARRMPFRAACFEQGLAAQRLLRAAGFDAVLHYGIAPGPRLEAHVWVSLDGSIILGGEQAPRFREVGQWP